MTTAMMMIIRDDDGDADDTNGESELTMKSMAMVVNIANEKPNQAKK